MSAAITPVVDAAKMDPATARAIAQEFLAKQEAQQAPASEAIRPQASPEQPGKRQDLQLQNDAEEAELEERLRAEDAQQQAPLPLPPQMEGMQSDDPSVLVTPQQVAQRSAANTAQAQEDIDRNAQNQRQIERAKGKTQADIARDSQADIDHLGSEIALRHDHLAKIQAEVEQQQSQSLANYQQVNTEMMNMAVAQPKDLYGAAGVNQILGRVAVFLGGAGVNGFHENRNLQYIEALAERNIQQQRQRFEMLSRVGEGQRTVYGMLNTRLSNAQQIDATLKNMALETYKANIMSVANKYADQTTKQAAQTEIEKINERQAQNSAAVEHQIVQDAHLNLQSYSQMQANQLAAYGAQLKARSGNETGILPVAGFVGGVPKSEHARISKLVGGSRILVDGLNQMEDMLKAGASVDTVRSYFVDNALLFKGARDFLETGTRIEAGEQSVIEAFKTNNSEAMFNILFGKDLAGLQSKISQSRREVVAATYQGVKSAAPKTAALDSRDPLFGPYNPRTYKGNTNKYFDGLYRNYNATEKGRGLLKNAQPYNGGY